MIKGKIQFTLIAMLVLVQSCSKFSNSEKTFEPTNKVILSSELVWNKLNPTRGEQSPLAATIWGDRNETEATGFLAKFANGFSSPPHIHNVTYRAVVIKGSIHNDDPKAENMWMKNGSFWTQSNGESHITAAKGEENIALVEISNGPYLVNPPAEAFDTGERSINIDASNVVWIDNEVTNWLHKKSEAKINFLIRNENSDGMKSLFVKLPIGFNGEIRTTGTVVHTVVISGVIQYLLPQNQEQKLLDSGSYFGSTNDTYHKITVKSEEEVILYMRTNGKLKVNSL
ncbi:uncharacterized protein DUF4437 [Roseivirga ehrenbergii]|uniref:DUF4437 domain-containing protein n=1 Tax=Roseivirga ehrenbergii (strain DSM 102268 / JCM 13514 / KCTC 12282 / NCIMB 14502 / KMM 6017) TaxID=279360 RepID=A0A150X7P1_ROSEK|nr:DUF4437 domain-containing protein [Roseivirga ehrenbergii]KYG74713.1 hypothetical protein MB14_05780 [Roseivirga ehrenbergii]TCL13962.1 uncharacterized protein DUF4437 [Roseivirga ehrenbergii]